MNWWDVNDSYGSDQGKKSIRLLSLLSLFHLFALGRENALHGSLFSLLCINIVARHPLSVQSLVLLLRGSPSRRVFIRLSQCTIGSVGKETCCKANLSSIHTFL